MEIDPDSKVCPICGYEFPGYTSSTKLIAFFLALLFLVMAIIGAIRYF